MPPTRSWTRFDTVAVAGLTTLGLVIRVVYVAAMQWSPSDPWRHLVLLRNLRAGEGFTPFIGEPYVWYQPPWHRLCAALSVVGPEWWATLCSAACIPALYLWLRDEDLDDEGARVAAISGGFLMAAYGPVVRFTCQYGSEAFAMALILAALLLALRREGYWSAIVAGLAVGLALLCRLNFAFCAPLFFPALRRPLRAAVVVAAAAVPLGLGWMRNARLLGSRDWVFTWDGLATPTDGFTPLSTFFVQAHPDVAEGLRRMHAALFRAGPEWVSVPAVAAFMVLAATGLAVTLIWARRPWPPLAALAMLVYMGLVESTGSSNFTRIWLGVFPALFAGIAFAAERLWSAGRWGRPAGAVGVALAVALGLPFLSPPQGASATLLGLASVPLEQVIPPRALLTEERYLVPSGFFHPESLIYRFPEKRFLGLPLDAGRFDAFQASYPSYRHILWHPIGVQDALRQSLIDSGRYRVSNEAANGYGYRYTVLEATD